MLGAKIFHLGGNFVEGLIPGNALVFAIHQFHGVTQTVVTMAMLTQCSALGALATHIDGGIKHGVLTNPYTILNRCIAGTANGTMGTNGAFYFNLALAIQHCFLWICSRCFLH